MAEERESAYSLETVNDISYLIESEISNFAHPQTKATCRQLGALYSRRSSLLWLNFRNYGGLIIIFVDILLEASLLEMKYEFIPYRLMIAHTAIAVE